MWKEREKNREGEAKDMTKAVWGYPPSSSASEKQGLLQDKNNIEDPTRHMSMHFQAKGEPECFPFHSEGKTMLEGKAKSLMLEGTPGGFQANIHLTARAAVRSHQLAQRRIPSGFEKLHELKRYSVSGQAAQVLDCLHG